MAIPIKITIEGIDNTGSLSDGFHTFDELYDRRAPKWDGHTPKDVLKRLNLL